MDHSSGCTELPLLGRICDDPSDQAAWEMFVACYGPRINGWCRQRGLQPADAEDVTQNVMVRLARALKSFSYDPSKTFMGWLRQITEHAISDFFLDRKRRPGAGAGSDHVLESVEARDELNVWLDREFADNMVSRAATLVRTKVEPRTWKAFQMMAYEGRAGDEVAERLGMAVTAVFKAKSRIIALMRKEVQRLDGQQ